MYKQNQQKKKFKTNMCIRFSTTYTKIPHDKLLDILYKLVDFVFKGGTRDQMITNKQGCALWLSKKESITSFLLSDHLKKQ